MSNVIQLSDLNRTPRHTTLPQGASAQIVIFHGVRVERLTEEMIEATAPRNKRRLPSLSNQATATELERNEF